MQCFPLYMYYQTGIRLYFYNCILGYKKLVEYSAIMGNSDQAHISTATTLQLYCVFIKDFRHFRLINLKNFFLIFVFTIFENSGLNYIILRWRFLIFYVDFCFHCLLFFLLTHFRLIFSQWPLEVASIFEVHDSN